MNMNLNLVLLVAIAAFNAYGASDVMATEAKPPARASKARVKPVVLTQQVKALNAGKQLNEFTQKASLELRAEVNRLKRQKKQNGTQVNDADLHAALVLANRFDSYTRQLKQRSMKTGVNDKNPDATLQTMQDMGQQLMMELQDAMDKQQQAMQVMSNIMKNQHDTLKSIIQNMR